MLCSIGLVRRITTTITGRNVLAFIADKCWSQVVIVGVNVSLHQNLIIDFLGKRKVKFRTS